MRGPSGLRARACALLVPGALLAAGALVAPAPALGDDVPGGEQVVIAPPRGDPWPMISDPVIRDMLALDAIAPFEDLAPLWEWRDAKLQKQVDGSTMQKLEL